MPKILSVVLFVFGACYFGCKSESFDRKLAVCPGDSISDYTVQYCCPASCEWCGGANCAERPSGASNCCTSQIERSCDENDAPCRINLSSVGSNICPKGGITDPSGKFCCYESCGRCGGEGCGESYCGAECCCTSEITQLCAGSDPTKIPCILNEIETSDLCPENGIIDSTGEFCCPKGCLTCGGEYCSTGAPLGKFNCCTSEIKSSCDDGELPCMINPVGENGPPKYPRCPFGGIPSSSKEYCCPESCGMCGGYGCESRPGGSSACCTGNFEKPCSENFLPCVMTEDSKCPLGGIYDEKGEYCCPSYCGSCGGTGCDKRPGGLYECCTSYFDTVSCLDNTLPCKVMTVCPTNSIFDPSGEYCCDISCGTCGGDGCENRGSDDVECCLDRAFVQCEQDHPFIKSLPCRIFPDPDYSLCETGIISPDSHFNIQICCPSYCSVCDTTVCSNFYGTECCFTDVTEYPNDAKFSCRYNSPPCLLPFEDDPCSTLSCQNGAKCGTEFFLDGGYDAMQPVCDCDGIGNYSGKFCEIPCSEGETPCGQKYSSLNFYTGTVGFNDKCCTVEEECLYIFQPEAGDFYDCFYKDRPTSCEPNLCLNGSWCENAGSSSFEFIGRCNCPDGFSGGFCQIQD